MLTLGLYALLAIAVMGAVFFVVASLLPAGEQLAPAVRDDRPWGLPEDAPLAAEDVERMRLPVALRGYRFAETDALLDRLGDELRARDATIAQLRAGGGGAGGAGRDGTGGRTEPDGGPGGGPDGDG